MIICFLIWLLLAFCVLQRHCFVDVLAFVENELHISTFCISFFFFFRGHLPFHVSTAIMFLWQGTPHFGPESRSGIFFFLNPPRLWHSTVPQLPFFAPSQPPVLECQLQVLLPVAPNTFMPCFRGSSSSLAQGCRMIRLKERQLQPRIENVASEQFFLSHSWLRFWRAILLIPDEPTDC